MPGVRILLLGCAAPLAVSSLLLGGCVGDTPATTPQGADSGPPGSSDGGPVEDASSQGDADAAPPPKCEIDAPFEGVAEVPINTDQVEFNVTLTEDERTLYFSTGELGSRIVIKKATRGDSTQPFSNLTDVALGATADESDVDPSISPDGKTLLFTSRRAGSSSYDLYLATNAGNSFQVTRITSVSSPGAEAFGVLDPRNEELWFVRTGASGSFSSGVRRAAYAGGTVGLEDAPLDFAVGLGDVQGLAPTADGKAIYMGRGASAAAFDIHVSKRLAGGKFGESVAAKGPLKDDGTDALNTPEEERASWLSPDQCRLYFTRTRAGTANRDVWMASRKPK